MGFADCRTQHKKRKRAQKMSSFKRKIKRKAMAKQKKRAKKDMSEKMGLFDKIPESCSACEKSFDKKDKEMVMSWNVVVREAQGVVRLYCPECWNMAIKAIEEVENG